MLTEIRGDLFTLDTEALAHGVNCMGVMGAGIAVEFKRRWPVMFHRYRTACSPLPEQKKDAGVSFLLSIRRVDLIVSVPVSDIGGRTKSWPIQ